MPVDSSQIRTVPSALALANRLSSGLYVTVKTQLVWFESREAVMPRPSHLDLDVPVSVHPAPDILRLLFCLCQVQIHMVRVLLLLYLCYSDARNRDRIHVLLLDSFCPNYRGFHPHDVDVPSLRL